MHNPSVWSCNYEVAATWNLTSFWHSNLCLLKWFGCLHVEKREFTVCNCPSILPCLLNVLTIFLNNLTDSPHLNRTLSFPLTLSHSSPSLSPVSQIRLHNNIIYISPSLTECLQCLTFRVLIHPASPSKLSPLRLPLYYYLRFLALPSSILDPVCLPDLSPASLFSSSFSPQWDRYLNGPGRWSQS